MQILVKDPKNGEELNMIEMQGDLESRLGANVDVSGKFIGDLHYTKDGGIPILIIGRKFYKLCYLIQIVLYIHIFLLDHIFSFPVQNREIQMVSHLWFLSSL